jgi:hypothetical protein
MSDIEDIMNDFNCTLLDLADNIAYVCPYSIIGNNIKDIHKTVRRLEKKNKLIEIFIVKILPYKDKIDEGDDAFFLGKSFNKDLDGDNSMINKVFEFKNIWTILKIENKTLLIQYMQLLCMLAQKYFVAIYGA